ncbi:MAG: hypothetical protein KGI57_11470 [Hyphomicrobiales bacterium]|nr:hypothetical protein [Hyphomicrobiales bacterium]MDE2018306.1 hypothetical protein [Hyphomicrobiales bacterium]
MTAFLLGIVHGVTPDEHTWPITYSYAVGGYSSRAGLAAGLTFSAAFTLQRAIASELAWFGLSGWFTTAALGGWVAIIVGVAMVAGGLFISRRHALPHLRPFTAPVAVHDAPVWMPALHGFLAGWGFGAFALILYGVLAPAMPSPWLGFAPGLMFGLGTMVVQAAIGFAIGRWAARWGLSAVQTRELGLTAAARTLTWGGLALALIGVLGFVDPRLADFGISTGVKVHNLDRVELPVIALFAAMALATVTTFAGVRRLDP